MQQTPRELNTLRGDADLVVSQSEWIGAQDVFRQA